jgi:hypothetical protein
VIDHIAEAIARLPHQYRGTTTEQALAAWLAPIVQLEAALVAVLTQRTIDDAIGAQLTVLGELVGRPRNGITDDEIYRRYVRAQIATNKSDGTIEDALTITRLVLGDPTKALTNRNEGAAAYVMSVSGGIPEAVAAVLIEMLIAGTGAGVRAILEFAIVSDAQVYRLDSGPGLDVGRFATQIDRKP